MRLFWKTVFSALSFSQNPFLYIQQGCLPNVANFALVLNHSPHGVHTSLACCWTFLSNNSTVWYGYTSSCSKMSYKDSIMLFIYCRWLGTTSCCFSGESPLYSNVTHPSLLVHQKVMTYHTVSIRSLKSLSCLSCSWTLFKLFITCRTEQQLRQRVFTGALDRESATTWAVFNLILGKNLTTLKYQWANRSLVWFPMCEMKALTSVRWSVYTVKFLSKCPTAYMRAAILIQWRHTFFPRVPLLEIDHTQKPLYFGTG